MPAVEPCLSPEEVAHLGAAAFDQHVRPVLQSEDDGKFVAIDLHSGDYELDVDDYAAVTRLRTRRSAAEVWLGRVGQPAAYRMRFRQTHRPEWSYAGLGPFTFDRSQYQAALGAVVPS